MGAFDGKVVWITGGGTGIGRAGALMFAREGATVALIGRRREPLDEVAKEAAAAGAKIAVEPLDVADRDKVDVTAKRLFSQFGRIDILVNNAGLNVVNRRLEELQPPDWDHVLAVNLTGAYNMINAVFPAMKKQQDGLIINIAGSPVA